MSSSLTGKRIFVGLSGGVDSAVTAALLQKEGATVTGVFIKGWYPPGLHCTWAKDRQDAMRVAAKLRIPFVTLDASAEYKKSVIDYLTNEYSAGRTPNPDIMCNKEVKFGAFYRFAREKGADFIATGHYAQNINGTLHRGVDESKDQSYFLWAIPKEVLPYVLFPLGAMHKSEVRKLAESFALPVADKKDSQGICFLGPVSIADFLRHEVQIAPGIARDEQGNQVGMHEGAMVYTLGERVAVIGDTPGPWYVVSKDMVKNQIVVSHEIHAALNAASDIPFHDANWFEKGDAETIEAQYRYHGQRLSGVLTGERFVPEVAPDEPLSSGQSLVFYKDTRVIGGGIIG